MPFYVDPNEEEQVIDGQPVTTGAGSSLISGAGEGASVTGEKNPGNFVGIQQYIAQNKPQTANLASNIAGNVVGESTKAQEEIGKQSQEFGQAVSQSTVNLNQPLFEEAKQNAVSVASDPTKLAQFQAMRDANYQGPQSFENTEYFNKANEAARKAQSLASGVTTEEGQKGILRGMQGQRNLNKGALTLDAALLSSDPTAQQKLLQAQQTSSGLSKQLQDVSSAGNIAAQQAKASTGVTAESIRNAFTGANSPQARMQADIEARVQAARQGYTSSEDINNALASGGAGLTDQQLTNIGLSRDQLNLIVNNPYLNQSNLGRFEAATAPLSNINAGSIGTAEEYARQAALNSLMGTSSNFLNTPQLAGTSQQTARFDLPAVSKEIGAALERKRAAIPPIVMEKPTDTTDIQRFQQQLGIYNQQKAAFDAANAAIDAEYTKYASLK